MSQLGPQGDSRKESITALKETRAAIGTMIAALEKAENHQLTKEEDQSLDNGLYTAVTKFSAAGGTLKDLGVRAVNPEGKPVSFKTVFGWLKNLGPSAHAERFGGAFAKGFKEAMKEFPQVVNGGGDSPPTN